MMSDQLAAMAKWPNVPACYDWLSLDRRGEWRLKGERVTHHGLIAFINRQYGCDDAGNWFLQNGPQRVFVTLACTPWIFRRDGDTFVSHTGLPTGQLKAIHLDEEGNLLLESALGIGLLDDRDLAGFFAECCDDSGLPASDEDILGLMTATTSAVFWHGMAIQPIATVDLKKRFKFETHPTP